MHHIEVVEGFEATEDLYEHVPDLPLREKLLALLVPHYLLEEVAVVRVLHDNAESVERGVDEDLLVGDDVMVLDAGQDTHLIDCICPLFVVELVDLNLLEGIRSIVGLALHMVDARVGPFTELLDDLKVGESGWRTWGLGFSGCTSSFNFGLFPGQNGRSHGLLSQFNRFLGLGEDLVHVAYLLVKRGIWLADIVCLWFVVLLDDYLWLHLILLIGQVSIDLNLL